MIPHESSQNAKEFSNLNIFKSYFYTATIWVRGSLVTSMLKNHGQWQLEIFAHTYLLSIWEFISLWENCQFKEFDIGVPVTISEISSEDFNLLNDWESGGDIKYLQIQGSNRSRWEFNKNRIPDITLLFSYCFLICCPLCRWIFTTYAVVLTVNFL